MKPTALGANIFAGLFTHGIIKAGYDVLGHLEHGPYGVATARLNYPKLDIRVGRENWNEKEFKNKVDFMFCNPPCAAWSVAGRKGHNQGNRGPWEAQLDRLRYVHDCVEAGINIKPRAWAWESVTQAWSTGHEFVVHQAEKWMDAGWHTTLFLQDNQFLGAPQERKRMFLIAHKHPLVWPKLLDKNSVITVGDALKNMKVGDYEPPRILDMKPGYKDIWKMSKNYGGYFRKTFEVERIKSRIPSVMERRLYLDRPAPVMISSQKRFHPTSPRHLNWWEWLALCGLPSTWQTSVTGSESATYELGRAVLPPVGQWLGKAVRDGLKLPALKGRPTFNLYNTLDPEHIESRVLSKFDGFTVKPINPPPLPPLEVKAPRSPRAPREGGPSKPGSGARIRELLQQGKGTKEILETIHKEFPGSRAGPSDVSWNKAKLRKMAEAA